jgi:L-aspartate oxidase
MNKHATQTERHHDILIVGAGLAGLNTALGLARDYRVALVTKEDLLESNTRYAQGGIAAVVDDGDSSDAHIRDTLIAGAGLCDRDVVEQCVRLGPGAVGRLVNRGVNFDRGADGHFELGREGGHSHRRILHVGDATGYAIVNPLVDIVQRHPNIEVFPFHTAVDLLISGDRVAGIECLDAHGQIRQMFAAHTILATGGCGRIFQRTTNPKVATGDGLALAIRVGAAVRHLEFYQFHPTCLALGGAPRFLVSEALRGEGGRLLNRDGEAFMTRYDARGDLAPRDIVARAIHQEMMLANGAAVLLDMTHLSTEVLAQRFPSIYSVCAKVGLEMSQEPIPVSPAAHYACGGISVDSWGNTTIEGLSAVGEVACTGLHGANRLASNSLLEAVVYAERMVEHLLKQKLSASRPAQAKQFASPYKAKAFGEAKLSELRASRDRLRGLMWQYVSIVRDDAGLSLVQAAAQNLFDSVEHALEGHQLSRELAEMRHMSLVSIELIRSARRRKRSVGLHYRTDDDCRA